MINPVSASVAVQASYGVQQAATKQPQPEQKASWPQDKVTIKGSGGDADHDGDSK